MSSLRTLIAEPAGGGTPIPLNGSGTLAASTVYNMRVATNLASSLSLWWSQEGGAGAVSASQILVSDNQDPPADGGAVHWNEPLNSGSPAYAFPTLPTGADGCSHVPISFVNCAFLLIRWTTGASPVTGLTATVRTS